MESISKNENSAMLRYKIDTLTNIKRKSELFDFIYFSTSFGALPLSRDINKECGE